MDTVIIALFVLAALDAYRQRGLPGTGFLVGLAAIIFLSFELAKVIAVMVSGYVPSEEVGQDEIVGALGCVIAFVGCSMWLFFFHVIFNRKSS